MVIIIGRFNLVISTRAENGGSLYAAQRMSVPQHQLYSLRVLVPVGCSSAGTVSFPANRCTETLALIVSRVLNG